MFDFDSLEPLPPVEFKHQGKAYVLREPTTDGAAKYRNAEALVRMTPDGQLRPSFAERFEGLNETDAVLVASCLFSRDDGGERPVTVEEVRALPDLITRPCYKWCRRAYDRAEELAKNWLGAGADTSS